MLKKMWEDIILSIGEAIVSAVGSGWLQKKKREKSFLADTMYWLKGIFFYFKNLKIF